MVYGREAKPWNAKEEPVSAKNVPVGKRAYNTKGEIKQEGSRRREGSTNTPTLEEKKSCETEYREKCL